MKTNTNLRIRVGGREYPAYHTMGALRRYQKARGSVEAPAADDVDAAITFLYCMTVAACNAEGVELGMDEETFADRLLAEDMEAYFNDFAAVSAPEADSEKPKKATPRRK